MSVQGSSAPAASPPAAHGGAMDPNEIRLRQIRAQQTAAPSADSANNLGRVATESPTHGGDLDPNEVRLRLARMQQTSSSSTVVNSPGQHSNSASQGASSTTRQVESQPAQYGSSSYLSHMPASPHSEYTAFSTHQSPQPAQTPTHSGQYFPAQTGQYSPFSNQAPQTPQSPQSGLPAQVCH